MKKPGMIIWLLLSILTMGIPAATSGELVLHIDHIRESKGKIWIGIYDSSENFLVKERARVLHSKVDWAGSRQVRLRDLPFGTYAITLFHDLNGNDQIDRNWLGIPSEPYAFSGVVRSKWRLPRFDEVRFHF